MKTDRVVRRARRMPVVVGSIPIGIGALSAGCVSLPESCPDRLRCADPLLAFAPDSAASGVGGAGGEGSACIPTEDGRPVPDGCGIFVRAAGSDDNAGGKDAPVATIAKAIALAANGSRRVYACAEVFAEELSLPAGIALYGGFDCDHGWVSGSDKRTTFAPRRGAPLRLGAEGVMSAEFSIAAPAGVKRQGLD